MGRHHGGRGRRHALRHVLGRGAQPRVVDPRHEASGSQSKAVDVENEREWTRATSDRDTLQMLLLRETPGTDHALLDQKRTERVVVTPHIHQRLTLLGNHCERGEPSETLSRTQSANIDK